MKTLCYKFKRKIESGHDQIGSTIKKKNKQDTFITIKLIFL